jgi:hypothetical protein
MLFQRTSTSGLVTECLGPRNADLAYTATPTALKSGRRFCSAVHENAGKLGETEDNRETSLIIINTPALGRIYGGMANLSETE